MRCRRGDISCYKVGQPVGMDHQMWDSPNAIVTNCHQPTHQTRLLVILHHQLCCCSELCKPILGMSMVGLSLGLSHYTIFGGWTDEPPFTSYLGVQQGHHSFDRYSTHVNQGKNGRFGSEKSALRPSLIFRVREKYVISFHPTQIPKFISGWWFGTFFIFPLILGF